MPPKRKDLSDKTALFGAVQRHGKVKAVVIGDRKNESVIPVMVPTIEKISVMVSDKWYSPKILNRWYSNVTIDSPTKSNVRVISKLILLKAFEAC